MDDVRSLSPSDIQKRNAAQADETERLFAAFLTALKQDKCDSCGKPLATFSERNQCFHWLLRPKGVKKQHVAELLTAKGYFRSGSYIRWLANTESKFTRVNDLEDENEKSVFHWSAAYRHIKWTFLCTESDLQGHANTNSDFPHFHFEMRLNGQIFIKFNDLHIRFTDEDTFNLRCNRDANSPIKQTFGFYGAGMSDAFSIPAETILEEAVTTPRARESGLSLSKHH